MHKSDGYSLLLCCRPHVMQREREIEEQGAALVLMLQWREGATEHTERPKRKGGGMMVLTTEVERW